ncbi:MAG: hypothetical protein GY818_13370 [Planctomycetaceae bacterium]|nr:hypothetical protein [Planctomycetaceae bacterium]
MATLQKENFSRWTVNNNGGSRNNCFPSIVATFLGMDTAEAESKCIGFPARRNGGGTKIEWSNPAQQITDSFGVGAKDMLDMSENNRYNVKRYGTTSQVAKRLDNGVYVIIHSGHAYGLIVSKGKAYTVDYGNGNAARRVVWTCTRLDGVNPDSLLEQFRNGNKKSRTRTFSAEDLEMLKALDLRAKKIADSLSKKKEVRVCTTGGKLHNLSTAEDSREFVRKYGDDKAVLPVQWDRIHDLQF